MRLSFDDHVLLDAALRASPVNAFRVRFSSTDEALEHFLRETKTKRVHQVLKEVHRPKFLKAGAVARSVGDDPFDPSTDDDQNTTDLENALQTLHRLKTMITDPNKTRAEREAVAKHIALLCNTAQTVTGLSKKYAEPAVDKVMQGASSIRSAYITEEATAEVLEAAATAFSFGGLFASEIPGLGLCLSLAGVLVGAGSTILHSVAKAKEDELTNYLINSEDKVLQQPGMGGIADWTSAKANSYADLTNTGWAYDTTSTYALLISIGQIASSDAYGGINFQNVAQVIIDLNKNITDAFKTDFVAMMIKSRTLSEAELKKEFDTIGASWPGITSKTLSGIKVMSATTMAIVDAKRWNQYLKLTNGIEKLYMGEEALNSWALQEIGAVSKSAKAIGVLGVAVGLVMLGIDIYNTVKVAEEMQHAIDKTKTALSNYYDTLSDNAA